MRSLHGRSIGRSAGTTSGECVNAVAPGPQEGLNPTLANLRRDENSRRRGVLQERGGQAGYLDKALWLQGEIMKKYPEHRAGDLYQQAMLEKRMKRYDDALRDLDESLALGSTDQDRISRLLDRAEIIEQRDGASAGLASYREVERIASDAGHDAANEARKRADRIEELLSTR
jgi:hypothetical protein